MIHHIILSRQFLIQIGSFPWMVVDPHTILAILCLVLDEGGLTIRTYRLKILTDALLTKCPFQTQNLSREGTRRGLDIHSDGDDCSGIQYFKGKR